jgi:hypothetical protein
MRQARIPLKAALFAVLGLATAAPAAAVPANFMSAPVQVAAPSEVQNVQYRSSNRRSFDERRLERRGSNYYYNGHRGYRYARPGWRSHNGWWFPPAAFALGAIVGSQYARPAPRYYAPQRGLTRAHVNWCENRYRTYRAWDNSYVPRAGYRAQCRSPYL